MKSKYQYYHFPIGTVIEYQIKGKEPVIAVVYGLQYLRWVGDVSMSVALEILDETQLRHVCIPIDAVTKILKRGKGGYDGIDSTINKYRAYKWETVLALPDHSEGLTSKELVADLSFMRAVSQPMMLAKPYDGLVQSNKALAPIPRMNLSYKLEDIQLRHDGDKVLFDNNTILTKGAK